VEWSGVEWSGVEWSGVEWSGVEWSGVEWSGVEWKKRQEECRRVVCGRRHESIAHKSSGEVCGRTESAGCTRVQNKLSVKDCKSMAQKNAEE
jgi:hypothetical protein